MPLLTSPIDGSPMKQINRYGIEIDVCPTTGGVWLDKGELEKIIAMVQEAANQNAGHIHQGSGREEQRGGEGDRSYVSATQQRRRGEQRESPLEMIMDLFDF